MGSALCSASMKPLSPCWRGWVGGPSVEWGRLLSPFWVPSQRGSKKVPSQRGRSKKKIGGRRRGGGRGGQTGYCKYHFLHSG